MKHFLVLLLLFAVAHCAPCDIYKEGGTPCVAAHSTVRALYDAYRGNLYQVQRDSDKRTADIGLSGTIANAAAQDQFCQNTKCNITIIYDQSGMNNHLTVGTPGGANPRGNTPADAAAEAVNVRGKKVYSVYIKPGEGYFHNGDKQGIPTGSEPGGMYAVFGGNHFNGGCCFDYGNGEANHNDNGNAHMNALYFGTSCWTGNCSGPGPWIQADLENGLFPGEGKAWPPTQKSWTNRFVTAFEKNDGVKMFALKGANAQAGSVTTLYNGPLPNGYSPMKVEGGIILGTGGDDSSSSAGTFYEGAMTKGYPSDASEEAIQKDVVSAAYTV